MFALPLLLEFSIRGSLGGGGVSNLLSKHKSFSFAGKSYLFAGK